MSALRLLGELVRDMPDLLRSMAKDALEPAPKQRDLWADVTGKPGRWPEVLAHAKTIGIATPWTVPDVAEALVDLAMFGWPVELILSTPVEGWESFSASTKATDAARSWNMIRLTTEVFDRGGER